MCCLATADVATASVARLTRERHDLRVALDSAEAAIEELADAISGMGDLANRLLADVARVRGVPVGAVCTEYGVRCAS